jgi:hypothetical protein
MSTTIPPIRIETVAGKLAAIRNLEYPELLEQLQDNPRLLHVLLFLEFLSRLPGGWAKFCPDFTVRYAERIGTKTMLAITRPGEYSMQDREAIWRSIPFQFHYNFPVHNDRFEYVDPDLSCLTTATLKEKLLETARSELPEYLASLCNHVSQPFEGPWYFPGLIDSLIEEMDRHTAAEKKTFADTSITRIMLDDFNFAVGKKQTVHVVGNPRSGKTEMAKGYARCHPWLARYLAVPSSNAEADLVESVADALGLEYKPGRSGRDLRKRVEYVLRHTCLMMVLNEAQFLFPQRFSATTQPARLNWVRTEIIDKGLPLAICFTPQLYTPGLTSYLKKTGYVMDQWIGRRCIKRELPEQLPDEDLYAVARFHFPLLADDPDYLEVIVRRAIVSPNYLQFMPALAARLEWIMERDGHACISSKLLKSAMNDIMPAAPEKPQPDDSQPAKHSPAIKRATRPAAIPALEALARQVTPGDKQLLSTRSTQRSALHETVNH